MAELRGTGAFKDRWDDRDYPHIIGAEPAPDAYDLSPFMPTIRNQYRMNSCVAFTARNLLCALAKALGIDFDDYSPQWFWNWARAIEGTLNQNVGVYPRDLFQAMVDQKLLFESDWPYEGSNLDMAAPSSERQSKAFSYPELAYYRVTGGVEGIMSAISSGHILSFCGPWAGKWFDNPGVEGILPPVTVNDFGAMGHATTAYRYDKNKAYLYLANSWGTDWAASGYFIMPFEYLELLKKLGGYDCYYLNFKSPVGPIIAPPKAGCFPGSQIMKLFKR
jgi:hypothetical protein